MVSMVCLVFVLLVCVFVSSEASFITDLHPANNTLFAVLDNNCGGSLAYGPSAIDLGGEVGGMNDAYLSTNTSGKDLLHREWLQIVTLDTEYGRDELFRVYWTFPEERTLKEHFVAAVETPQTVSYRVVNSDGSVFEYEGHWGLESSNMAGKFDSTETQVGFTSGKVVWGAFEGILNFDVESYYEIMPIALSGVINYGDGSEEEACGTIYQQGQLLYGQPEAYPESRRIYFYYSDSHNDVPASVPDDLTHNVTMIVRQRIAGLSYNQCTELDAWDLVLKASILSTVGVRYDDIVDVQVLPMPGYYSVFWYETVGLIYTITLPEDRHISYADMAAYLNEHAIFFVEELILYALSQNIDLIGGPNIVTLYIQAEDPTNPYKARHTNKLSVGVIVGISIASCAALLCLCYLVPYLCKKLCFGCVLPHLEERDLELQSVHPQRNHFDMYAESNPAQWRSLRSVRPVRPVPTMAVTVTQVPRDDYLPVVVAEVQVVGEADDDQDSSK